MEERLYRSRKNKMIGGVCGGLAEYFDIDPVLMRAIFIITAIGWGIGFIAYIVLWIIMPDVTKIYGYEAIKDDWQPPKKEKIPEEKEEDTGKRKTVIGNFLIILGGVLLAANFVPWMDFSIIFPILLIAVGLIIFYKEKNKNAQEVNG